jgi:multidrug resistance protein MdtO
MNVVSESLNECSRALIWLRGFLKEELAPRPGRGVLVARMVIAATVVMIVSMTFRIPYGAFGAVYALIISRENPQATVDAVKTIVIAFAFAAVYILVGAAFFAGEPILRFLWVIGTLFAMFYSLSVIASYVTAVRFGYLIVVTIPLWDQHTTAETKVDNTLWAASAISVAILITAGIELIFAALRPADDFSRSVDERLLLVEDALRAYGLKGSLKGEIANRIVHLSMVGTSRLRRMLRRSGHSLENGEKLGAVVTLIGRLVDIAANLESFKVQISADDRARIEELAENIARIRTDLITGAVLQPVNISAQKDQPDSVPFLNEMELIVSMIPQAFEESQSSGIHAGLVVSEKPPVTFFVADAFSNPEHIKYALRGCLAASLCYVIYNLLAWPDISTAVTTCFLTALSTIGSSRQKQVLRFAGAIAGGVVGIAAQVFILPHIDSITGFTILFVIITIAAAWVATSGPRLSYLGIQFAVAFYFINVQAFKFQTSLVLARDRVVGILLGLFMMWVIYDRLWSVPAIVQMNKSLISILRSLAQLTREPVSSDWEVAVEKSYSLRENTNRSFDQVRDLADSVLFEFGPRRQEYLKSRAQILLLQPQLRMLFVTRVTLLKYRLQISGFELPAPVRMAQQEFDEHLARVLDGMADRLMNKQSDCPEIFEDSIVKLEGTINKYDLPHSYALAPHLPVFLELSRRMDGLVRSLDQSLKTV